MNKFLLFCLVASLAAPFVSAEDGDNFTYEGINYTVASEEMKWCYTQENTDYFNPIQTVTGDVVIPSVVKNGEVEYTVVAIGQGSFQNCQEISTAMRISR